MTNSTHCTLLAKQACTTLSHVVQKITPPSANNFLKCLFVPFALLTLGAGTAWAENAPVNTVLWGENFEHFETNTPSNAKTGTGTTIYDGASITYTQSSTSTKGYNEKLAGGTAPELLLSKSNQTWTISGIKTGGATKMSLTFLSNKTAFSVSVSSANLTVSGSDKSWTITLKDGQTVPETFDLTIKNTASKDNARIDDVVLKVTVAGTTSATPVDPEVSFSNSTYTVGQTLDLSTLWTSNSDGAVTYSIVEAGTTGASINGKSFTASAAGTCTVKASQAATSAYNAIETTATITVTATTPEEPGGDGEETWILVTDASTLKADDEVIIAASGDNKYALSTTQKSSNRAGTAITKNGNTLVEPSADVQILTLKAGSTSGTFAFYTGTSGYLYAASSSNNQLKTKTTLDVHGSWTISITEGVASIAANGSSNRNVMQYNYNNGDPLFNCYASASQTALAIYKKITSSGSGSEETVLSVEPEEVAFGTKNIYFESEKQGSLEIDITGQNLTGNVTATITEDDDNVFSLSSSSFAPNAGEVSDKLTVSYDVSEYSEEKGYTATLTLSSDGVEAIELPITLTTINKKPTVYTKVTDAATLSAGDKVIFVYEAGKVAAGKLSSGYLTSIDIAQAINTTANPATVSITDEAVIEYTLGGTTGAWELISAGNKLSEKTANSGSSVDLKANGDTKWTISVTEGNATIKGSDNTIKYNTSSPRFKTYSSGQTAIQLYTISVPKYAVNFTQPEGGELLVKNGETAITSGNTFAEGIKLTVTATPANGYEGGTVVVKDAVGNDVTATVYADGVLTMPAYAVTISATFEEKPCELLVTPIVSATTTYNSAKLTWEAVANAAKYSVKIGSTDAVETTETSYEVTGLTAETEYAYQVKAIAVDGQTNYCDSEVAKGKFTTAAAPTATLTLKDIVGTTTQTGALNSTITLPTTAAECSKTFVGWDADENCNHAPTYAPGAEYTFTTLDPTLYAVYADEKNAAKEEVYTFTEFAQANTVTIEAPESFTITLLKGNASTAPQWNAGSSQARIYAKGSLVISAEAPISKIVYTYIVNKNSNNVVPTIDGVTGETNAGTWDSSEKTWTGNDTKVTFSTSGTAGNVGFTKVAVTVGAITYSNYSTTCAAALEKPTFSVAEGTYTEAKSIELSATEGDIYYTLDGNEPTESSTQYTAAIALNECGTTTIKAIAIGAGSQSPIASATYTINLPITNTAATAYTPAEAIAIIDGDCDKTEEVFVKGVVVSTSAFSAEYGNYDVIVKAVDDNSATPTTFTFYRMYKAASKTKFTASDDVIGVGDIITAKGVLKKYNSTYELADGCYMVEREAFTEPKTDISNTLETAYTVDKAFELISDVKSDLDKEVYVKGLVAVASTQLYEEKYLTYSISDNGQTTGNVLKVYDGLDIGGVAFTSKDDVKVGDYVVVKGKLFNYGGTYEINKDNQLVEHISAATITIADITMEVGETKTITATVVPAEAEVTYTIKENAANAISLSGNTITALAEGTATITATVAETNENLAATAEFTVTVTSAEQGGEDDNIKTATLTFDDTSKRTTFTTSQQIWTENGVTLINDKSSSTSDVADYYNPARFYKNSLITIKHTSKKITKIVFDCHENAYADVLNEAIKGAGVMSDDEVTYTLQEAKESFAIFLTAGQVQLDAIIVYYYSDGSETPDPDQDPIPGYNPVANPTTLSGVFSVAADKKVQFSTGNLQYEVGTNTWLFASKQYEVMGGAPYDPANPTNTNYGMNVPNYTGKLDLFAWSCDGKYGVNPSNTDSDYQGTFVDWGTLAGEGWFTLTKEEMNYILNRTKNGKKLWALATIDDLPGLILLPDNWNTNITLTYGYIPDQFVYQENLFTAAEWKVLEVAGAVFLPAAGSRTGGYGNKDNAGFKESYDANGDYFHVDNVGIYGYYWLNTQDPRPNFKHCASYLILPGWDEGPTVDEEGLDDLSTHPQVWSREKRRGNSVRLVKTVEEEPKMTVSGRWELVTDASTLAIGDKVVIAAKDYNYALSTTQKENNRGQAAVTKHSDKTISFTEEVQVLTLEAGTVKNTFAFNTGNGYLYAASSSGNHLKTQNINNDNGIWKITITDGTASIVAQGTNTRRTMQYNQTSSLFACYESASQKALCLYRRTNVKVYNNQEATTNDIPNYSDVTVGSTGQLNVEKPLIVENLYIQTTMGAATSAQISNATNTNLLINGDVFIDITLGKNGDPNQWHAFTVPFPVDAMNGVYDLNDKKLTNEVNYAIMDYHGDLRANGQYGWKKYRGILVPGTFYLMTVDGARDTYRFKKVEDAAIVAPATKAITAFTGSGDATKDKGWNGVGNPTLMHGKVGYKALILNPESYTYEPIPENTAYFTVGTPFFIQAATDGTMTMDAETSASLAPARRAAAAVENIKVMLGNSDYTDRLYVSASEDAINEYEIGKDLGKMAMTNTPRVVQISALAYDTRLCMIDAPMANNEALVALNLYAPANGEYTLSIEAQDNEKVYLLHEGTFVWDLSMSEYPITLNKGDNTGYSILVRRADAPTSVETIDGTNNQTEKLIHNGNLYILHNGKVFDAVGTMLK